MCINGRNSAKKMLAASLTDMYYINMCIYMRACLRLRTAGFASAETEIHIQYLYTDLYYLGRNWWSAGCKLN